MLKARAWQERGNSYVCALCRSKLSNREGQPRGRRFSGATSPASIRKAPLRLACLASHPSSARALSTSAVFQAPDDSGGPKPGGFPNAGLGGFGFGGFGVKKKESSQPLDALLPHEREARERQKVVVPRPVPAKPAAAKPALENSAPSGHSKKSHQGKPHRGHRNSKESKEVRSEERPSTSALLAQAFNTNRPLQAPSTPKNETAESSEPPKAEKSQFAWGSFSARRVQTDVPVPKLQPKVEDEKRASVPSTSGGAAKPGDKEAGSSQWDLLLSTRRVSEDKTTGGFWNALDNRVSEFSKKQSDILATQSFEEPPKSEEEESQTKRSSRFEMEEEQAAEDQRRGKKDKREKKSRSRQRDDDEDWDDEAIKRWEARQRRKAEKEARKQAGQQVEQKAPQIFLPEYISVANLARALKLRVPGFLHDLEQMGFEDLTEDTIMTGDTAALVAMEYGFDPTVDTGSQRDLRPRPPPEDPSTIPTRPPVVTIMGHVDHGKTTLLDWLRKSSVAAQEHGGITQHIGAFVVQMSTGKPITFLDTPGHAAFLSMRQRGANVTDIVVLVVAADDSVMPQTIEALKHATSAKVPIIVAINKIDKEDARVDQVKADLSRNGVEIEDYGGDVQVVCVSGKTGQGMEDLEENIVTLSEILDVRAESDGMAEGWILESSVKQNGKAATVLVKRGTLRLGDLIVAGKTWARIRVLRNEAGVEIAEAPPGTPVEILGWRELPEAGEQVLQAPDEDKAKTAVEYRQEMSEREESSVQLAQQEARQREKAAAEEAAALAEAEGEKAADTPAEPGIILQNFIIKADVAGSVEAVCGTVQEIGNHEVQARILRSGVGPITEHDVDQASISKGIIVNFNNAVMPHIRQRASEASVRIIDHSVIYHVADEVKDALSDLLPQSVSLRVLGEADVLQVFSINIRKRVTQNIAGCKVRNGSIKRTSMVKVLRRGQVVYQGKIDTLKHVKKDVMEMGKGTECGIGLEDFQDLQIDDQIQTYEELKEKRSL